MAQNEAQNVFRRVFLIFSTMWVIKGIDGLSEYFDIDGIFVTDTNQTTELIEFHSQGGWQILSSPGAKIIHIKIFLSTTHDSDLYLGFTNTSVECTNVTDQYSLNQIGNYRKADVSLRNGGLYNICLFKSPGVSVWINATPFTQLSIKFQPASFQLSVWLTSILIVILQFLSGLCSALNIGLMALDPGDLRIIMEAGNAKQRKHAKSVYRLRSHGNFLLISILICNTAFNAVNTVLLESLVEGLAASIIATIMITIFGEIVPQAIGSRFAIRLGAVTAPFTAIMMIITSIVSWPMGKLLDFVLGKQPPAAYPREKVQVLLREQVPGVKDYETAMISGLLGLESKNAKNHMRRLNDVFMVDYDAILDENLYIQICESGYSRIPVYKGERPNIVGVLHIKDLSLLGTYGHSTVGSVCDEFKLPFARCRGDTNMNNLLLSIKEAKSHMVIVHDENNPHTNFAIAYRCIAIEDIIEELLAFDILDEFDKSDEEKNKRLTSRRTLVRVRESLSIQLKAAAFRLMRTLEPFGEDEMAEHILSELIEECYFVTVHGYNTTLYKYKKPADYFILIISGRAIVELPEEGIHTEAGPFTYFGLHALIPPNLDEDSQSLSLLSNRQQILYFPEFSLYTTEKTGYIKIDKFQWIKACRVTPSKYTNLTTQKSRSLTSNASLNEESVPVGLPARRSSE
ncbi:hypothetical protein ACOME3_003032 [Neoechinorhynchus agilis]